MCIRYSAVFYCDRSHITAPCTNAAVRLPHPASRWSQCCYGKKKSYRAGGSARKDGREPSKLATGGDDARINIIGAPTVAKKTKPSDPLQVQVKSPWYLYPKKDKITIRILEATRSINGEARLFLKGRDVYGYKHSSRGSRFSIGRSMN